MPLPSIELRAMLEEGLEPALQALTEAEVPSCLVGSLGAWVYGANEPTKDTDLVIHPRDIIPSAQALSKHGFRLQTAGIDDWAWWFFRAWVEAGEDKMPLEIIFAPIIDPEQLFSTANEQEVGATTTTVASLTDILALKLAGLREDHPNGTVDKIDIGLLLHIARQASDQVDWQRLHHLVDSSPYARAFLSLVNDLGISELKVSPEAAAEPFLLAEQQRLRTVQAQQEIEVVRENYTVPSYELLGAEYYDQQRHPTCAEFYFASRRLIKAKLPETSQGTPRFLEVGAGASILAPALQELAINLNQLQITDINPSMLEHSRRWETLGAQLSVAGADNLPCEDASIDYLVASLGDPYNQEAFWKEASRVLAEDGQVIFTAPSFYWAQAQRAGAHKAKMALGDGHSIEVPSYVFNEEDQRQMIESVGLSLLTVSSTLLKDIPPPTSGALHCLDPEDPVITCFQVRR